MTTLQQKSARNAVWVCRIQLVQTHAVLSSFLSLYEAAEQLAYLHREEVENADREHLLAFSVD